MARTAIPVLIPVLNGETEVDLYAAGVALAAAGEYVFVNPGGRTVLLAILATGATATVVVKAVPDPFGRGDSGDDVSFSLAIGTWLLNRYQPAGFNQSGVSEARQVEVDCTALAGGNGVLVALSL